MAIRAEAQGNSLIALRRALGLAAGVSGLPAAIAAEMSGKPVVVTINEKGFPSSWKAAS
jgi:hypothetical protein